MVRPGEWYERLKKPSWRPPHRVFAPVWTILMIAVAGWLIWLKAGFTVARLPLARDQEAERRSRHVLVDKVGLFHSARMLWALITPAQRLVSSATYLPKSSGDIGRGTSPVLAARLRILSDPATSFTAVLSLVTMSGGRPAGANNPSQSGSPPHLHGTRGPNVTGTFSAKSARTRCGTRRQPVDPRPSR